MPYTHIPESGMAGGLARIIGKIQGKLNGAVLQGMLQMSTQLAAPQCPSDRELDAIENKRNKLNNQLRSSGDALGRFRSIPGKLRPPISGLNAAIRILLAIPIPQAVPPGIGIPVLITNKFGDILVLLKEVVAQIGELVAAIEAALEVPSSQLASLQAVNARMDVPMKSCRIQNQLMRVVEAEEIEPELLEESGLVTFFEGGGGVNGTGGSNLTRQVDHSRSLLSRAGSVFLQDAGRTTDEDAVGFSLTETSLQLLEDGLLPESARDDASNDQQRQLLLDDLVQGLTVLQSGNIPDSVRDSLMELANTFAVLGEESMGEVDTSNDPRFDYTGPDGTHYRLSIIPDTEAPAIAPRNFAEARDLGGVLRYTGPKSFSQDIDILLDEVKFLIDNDAYLEEGASERAALL